MKCVVFAILCSFCLGVQAAQFVVYPKEGKSKLLKQHLRSQKISFDQALNSDSSARLNLSEHARNALVVSANDRSSLTFVMDFIHKIENNSPLQLYANEYEGLQWGLHNDGSSVAFKLTDIDQIALLATKGEDINLASVDETGAKVRVAVIDSGVDLEHKDLKNTIYSNSSECEALTKYEACIANSDKDQCDKTWLKVDSDGNGYPLDCHGWNVAAPKNAHADIQGNHVVQDLLGHGTHIAGIIAGKDDAYGIKGVADNIEILPVKVSGSDEVGVEDSTTDIFAKGLLYALANQVDIINMSVGWASDQDSLLVTELINKAHEMGVILVVAAGNSAHSSISYPCSYSEVICVGSHDPDGGLSVFSNRGGSVDIIAPGKHILSAWPMALRPKKFTQRHGFEFKDGTSFAAPFVAGVAAKLMSLGRSSGQVRADLLSGARPKVDPKQRTLNGNLDFVAAYRSDRKSFIYPHKKTPALINWNKEQRQLGIKLKNFLRDEKSVRLKLISLQDEVTVTSETMFVENWKLGEIKEFEFLVTGNVEIDSDLDFELEISTSTETDRYPVQAVAVTVIHDDLKKRGVTNKQIQSYTRLSAFTIKAFENISAFDGTDFLVVDDTQEKVHVALLKDFDTHYKLSTPKELDLPQAYFAHLARVDLQLDGAMEYVLIAFKLNEKEEWLTRAYVFDSNFNLTDQEIFPGNEIDNQLTTFDSSVRWLKIEGALRPSWISFGFIPKADLKPHSPWELPELNTYAKRLYYYGPSGTRNLRLLIDDVEYVPNRFLKQTLTEKQNYQTNLLFSTADSYLREYYLGNPQALKLDHHLRMDRYQNLAALEGQDFNAQIFFFSNIDLDDYLTHISVVNRKDASVIQHRFRYPKLMDPIQLVFAKSKDSEFFALTKYNLLHLDGNRVTVTESRNTDRLNQYKKLRSHTGLYLSSLHTPGYSSEKIEFKDNEFYRSSNFRFLPFAGCSEADFISSDVLNIDQSVFYCEKKNKLIFVEL